jgi:endonuclease YncB( thermonuclease family)
MRIALFALLFAAAVPALALPRCAGRVVMGNAHVARVEKDGTLFLKDGHAALLEGIRLPKGKADAAPPIFAKDALAALTSLARAGALILAAPPPPVPQKDRYGRLRVQAFGKTGWLQILLLEHGMARVEIAPDRSECAARLYAAEGAARRLRHGLWAAPAYRVRDAVRLGAGAVAPLDSFQIVEGRVLNASIHSGRAFLDFGTDYHRDFSATISKEDRKRFKAAGIKPRSYKGKRVRLRGFLRDYHGPEIQLSNPAQIEILP